MRLDMRMGGEVREEGGERKRRERTEGEGGKWRGGEAKEEKGEEGRKKGEGERGKGRG